MALFKGQPFTDFFGLGEEQEKKQIKQNMQPIPPHFKEKEDRKDQITMMNVNNKEMVHSKENKQITIVEPQMYSEALAIAKKIIHEEAVIVNFHLIEESQARRIVDFLTGTVYALGGDIQRIDSEIFLCTPNTIEIDGDTAQTMLYSQFDEV